MRLFFLILCLSFFAFSTSGYALSLIRDTEIEQTLKAWAEPVLKEAGLSNDQVRIALVNSSDVNAFVAGGSNIFIYAGLIQTAEYPEEVIGVIAHEIGHITGGHLIATKQALKKSSMQSILSTVIGVGAAVVTGDGRAAGAISAGGSGLAQRGFLSHSRIQESAADQAGLRYLKAAEINPKGLETFLTKLESEEFLPASQQSEYMRTHPLTRDRINTVKEEVKELDIQTQLGQSNEQAKFDLIKAKLLAFREPQMVPRYYDMNTGNLADVYAYGIMHYQQKHFDQALSVFDQLLEKYPADPYIIEMKAQILRDAGRLAEAEKFYQKSLDYLGETNKPLIQIALAHVLIEQNKDLKRAEDLLLQSLQSEGRDIRAYRLLATIKGRQGKEGHSQYYLAEEAFAIGRRAEARRLVELALRSKTLDNVTTVKANDLKIYLNRLPDS